MAGMAGTASAKTLQGSVREKGTRALIQGAVVYIKGNSSEAITDENGEFVLRVGKGAKRTGNVTLHIEVAGYQEFVQIVRLSEKETTKFDAYLTQSKDDTFETFVRERRSVADQSRGAHSISEREVNEQPGTYGDPAKAIENFPGMGRVRRSQGSLFVRGAQPDDTGVYVDGFEIPDLYHFTGSTSVINIPFVESVLLVPGAFSSRFGRATGGLVQLKTRKLPTDAVHGFVKADIIDAGAYVGVPLAKNAAIGLSARRSYLDVFRNAQRALSEPSNEIALIPTYWDYQAKLDWDIVPGQELVLFVFGSGDRELYVRDETSSSDPYIETVESDFHRISGRYKNILSGGFTNEFTGVLGFERRTRDVQNGERQSDIAGVDLQLREELRYTGDDMRITLGIDAVARTDVVRFGGAFANESVRELPLTDESFRKGESTQDTVEQLSAGLYAEGTFEPMRDFMLTPGVRFQAYNYNDDDPEFSLEPRFAGQYTFFAKSEWPLRLKGAAGVFSRPPKAADIAVAKRFGRALQSQQALHLQSGFEQQLGPLGMVSFNVFTIWRDHVIQKTEDFPLVQPENPLSAPLDATSAGFSYGAEAIVRLASTKRYFAWASYSITRHEKSDGFGIPREDRVYVSESDTSHLLTLVGQMELLWGFRAGVRYRAVTGMPFTPISQSRFDADTNRYVPIVGERNSQRFETFHGLDLRIDWAWLLPWCEVDFYADLINVLNIRPREDTEYNFDFSQERPINGLPVIPTLGFKVTF